MAVGLEVDKWLEWARRWPGGVAVGLEVARGSGVGLEVAR